MASTVWLFTITPILSSHFKLVACTNSSSSLFKNLTLATAIGATSSPTFLRAGGACALRFFRFCRFDLSPFSQRAP